MVYPPPSEVEIYLLAFPNIAAHVDNETPMISSENTKYLLPADSQWFSAADLVLGYLPTRCLSGLLRWVRDSHVNVMPFQQGALRCSDPSSHAMIAHVSTTQIPLRMCHWMGLVTVFSGSSRSWSLGAWTS
jgi:hypothetical protein